MTKWTDEELAQVAADMSRIISDSSMTVEAAAGAIRLAEAGGFPGEEYRA